MIMREVVMTAEEWREDLITGDGSENMATRCESYEARLHKEWLCQGQLRGLQHHVLDQNVPNHGLRVGG